MCGRFTITAELPRLQERFHFDMPEFEYTPRYNVAPGQNVLVLFNSDQIAQFRWGLIPSWAKDPSIGQKMINARAETVAEKPSFKRSLQRRRCLVLADGFYEWKKEGKAKLPIWITLKSREPFGFAGLWDSWKSSDGQQINSCTIITTIPNELVSAIHHRMAVILSPESEKIWLDPLVQDEASLKELLVPYPTGLMEAYAVSPLVNSPKNDFPECIKPVSYTVSL